MKGTAALFFPLHLVSLHFRLCYNCKQPGHESNACPQPRTSGTLLSPNSSNARRLEAKQCYHCQGIGHVQSDCPSLRIARQVQISSFRMFLMSSIECMQLEGEDTVVVDRLEEDSLGVPE